MAIENCIAIQLLYCRLGGLVGGKKIVLQYKILYCDQQYVNSNCEQ